MLINWNKSGESKRVNVFDGGGNPTVQYFQQKILIKFMGNKTFC